MSRGDDVGGSPRPTVVGLHQPSVRTTVSTATTLEMASRPVVTIAGVQLGGVIAFAIVTETVFQWPGLGALFVNAVQFVDVPVMSAYLLFVAFVFVLTSLLVDIAYVALDPRLRGGALVPAR